MAHEENEFCKRQWNLGYSVVYLPSATVCHHPSEMGRDSRQRAKLNARNAWYQAILHEPLPILAITFPLRLVQGARYLRWAKAWTGGEWWGLYGSAVRELVRDLPELIVRRKSLQYSTLRRWQRIKKNYPPYLKLVTPALDSVDTNAVGPIGNEK